MAWESYEEVYEHIGKFCVEFELFCGSMEACIRNVLHVQNLTNESIQTILLTGLTAEPLRTLLQRLTGETILTEENKALLSKAFNELQKLIGERNNLIHCKWYIYGYETQEEINKILVDGEKLHANKEGESIKNVKLEKEKVEMLIQKCRDAGIIISLIARCIIRIRKVEDCFSIENDNLIINHDALKPVVVNMTVGKDSI